VNAPEVISSRILAMFGALFEREGLGRLLRAIRHMKGLLKENIIRVSEFTIDVVLRVKMTLKIKSSKKHV